MSPVEALPRDIIAAELTSPLADDEVMVPVEDPTKPPRLDPAVAEEESTLMSPTASSTVMVAVELTSTSADDDVIVPVEEPTKPPRLEPAAGKR